MESSDNDRSVLLLVTNEGQLCHRLARIAQLIPYAEEHGLILVSSSFGEYGRYFLSSAGRLLSCYPGGVSVDSNTYLHHLFTLFYKYLKRTWIEFRWAGLPEIEQNVEREGLSWLERCPDPTIAQVFHKFSLSMCDFVAKHAENFTPFSLLDQRSVPADRTCSLSSPECSALLRHRGIGLLAGDTFFRDSFRREDLDAVRRFFHPMPHYDVLTQNFLMGVRHEGEILVGVHIRQTDYREWNGGRFFYSSAQYAELMRTVRTLFPQPVRFLVCSSEKQDPGIFSELTVAFGHGDPMVDLLSLSTCDFIMGPPSGYSTWASVFGQRPLYHIHSVTDRVTVASFERIWERPNPYLDRSPGGGLR